MYSCVSGSLVGYGTHWTAHALNGVSVGTAAFEKFSR